MSARVVQLGSDVHQKMQALLPWYVCSRLSVAERVRVEAHIAECTRCQAELAWERRLQAAHVDADVPADVDQGFALMRERIAGAEAPRRRNSLAARVIHGWRAGPMWMRWALMGEFAAVAALSVLLVVSLAPEGRYRALGRSTVAPGTDSRHNLIVRFRPDVTEEDIRQLLRASEAKLVYGPTITDAYVLTVPSGEEKAAVAHMRGHSAVLLVESLDERGVP